MPVKKRNINPMFFLLRTKKNNESVKHTIPTESNLLQGVVQINHKNILQIIQYLII